MAVAAGSSTTSARTAAAIGAAWKAAAARPRCNATASGCARSRRKYPNGLGPEDRAGRLFSEISREFVGVWGRRGRLVPNVTRIGERTRRPPIDASRSTAAGRNAGISLQNDRNLLRTRRKHAFAAPHLPSPAHRERGLGVRAVAGMMHRATTLLLPSAYPPGGFQPSASVTK